MLIRQATINDINEISNLLRQIQQIHFEGRPDIFKCNSQKYSASELKAIIANDATPIFVYVNDTKQIIGYVFCVITKTENSNTLNGRSTLFIDDLCVDASYRGQGIGMKLFEFAKKIAIESQCEGITLNVWNFNTSAINFYQKIGMKPLKTTMEMNFKEVLQ